MSILIKNADYIVIDSINIERNSDILIEGKYITKVGKVERRSLKYIKKPIQLIDASSMAVIPGLINTHTHLYQNFLKGMPYNLSLVNWCEKVLYPFCRVILNEFEQGIEETGYYYSLLASLEMIKNGITTFVDMETFTDSIIQAWIDIGIRGIGALVCGDLWIPQDMIKSPNELRKNILNLIDKWHQTDNVNNLKVGIMLGPSAPFVCSKELLSWCRDVAEERNIKIQIHVSETNYELEEMLKKYGKRPVEFLEELQFLSEKVSAVHCIHLTENEIDILGKRKVSMVHCPKSNMKLASGVAPVVKMLKKGINISLACDGSASNDNQDLFEEMRFALLLQKLYHSDPSIITANDVFKMATENGANVCGLNSGVLKKGKLADLVLIDLNQPHIVPIHDIIQTLVYCCRGSDVHTVIIGGEIVMLNKEIKTIDEEKVIKKAKLLAKEKFSKA